MSAERRERWTDEEARAAWEDAAKLHLPLNATLEVGRALLDARADADAVRQQRDEALRRVAVLAAECRAWRTERDASYSWPGGEEAFDKQQNSPALARLQAEAATDAAGGVE